MKKKKIVLLLQIAAGVLLFFALFYLCGKVAGKKGEIPSESLTDFALNTTITVTIYKPGENAGELLRECMKLCDSYETVFSRTKKEAELAKINAEAKTGDRLSFPVSKELSEVLSYALSYAKMTKGGFEPSIEPVSSLWNFTADKPSLPKDADIKKALGHVSYENISLDGRNLTLKEKGMGLDLGGIAKGYIADRLKEYLVSEGVESAVISLGGNILCVGEKKEDTPFRIGVQMPFAEYQKTIAVLACKDCSVVTSGIYERCFEKDGKLYHHILNPKTGYPYDNDLLGVTVVSEKSVDGDALSTSCYALGLSEGMKFIESLPDVYALFITKDGALHYSEGFREKFLID